MLHSPADYARFREPAVETFNGLTVTYRCDEIEIGGQIVTDIEAEISCRDDIEEFDGISVGGFKVRLDSPRGTLEWAIVNEMTERVLSSGEASSLFRQAILDVAY